RTLALADFCRKAQVQRAADPIPAKVEQPEYAFSALPLPLFHATGGDDPLAVEILELVSGDGACVFQGGFSGRLVAGEPAYGQAREMLALKVVEAVPDHPMLA